jgi:hypothetical protein
MVKIVTRTVLFTVLAYMLFALAYDYLYLLPTHERKFNGLLTALSEGKPLLPAEQTARGGKSATPADVAAYMGFKPLVPLKLDESSGYFVELYRYRSAIFVREYDIEVYYTGKPDRLTAIMVAHMPEERPGGGGGADGDS